MHTLSQSFLRRFIWLILLVGLFGAHPIAAQNSPILDPLTIPKFVDPLVIPPAMPPMNQAADGFTEYAIAVRQFQQQVLPTGLPQTTVWGYGNANDPSPAPGVVSSFNYPAFTIETRSNAPIRVTWMNQLVDNPGSPNAQYLPHLFAIDQTLHWANPAARMDMESMSPEPYMGPVPIVTHVHGAHVAAESDGYPEAWFMPAASNLPEDLRTQGNLYASAQPAEAGSAVFEYSNSQRATTL